LDGPVERPQSVDGKQGKINQSDSQNQVQAECSSEKGECLPCGEIDLKHLNELDEWPDVDDTKNDSEEPDEWS
jgi:hypothetical protein